MEEYICCQECNKNITETRMYKLNGKHYCNRHYQQIRRVGRIIRTKYDGNEIILKKDYAEILLYSQNGNVKGKAIIDLNDVDKVKMFKWHLNEQGYIGTDVNKERILLHRFITNADEDKVVDHINHNTSDNRKKNLRICTQVENMQNTTLRIDNTSGVKGVSYSSKEKKWRAYITFNKKTKHLGWFETKEKAIKVRKEAGNKYFQLEKVII